MLLLVSPICSECVLGAKAVRSSILDRYPEVAAIVVWQPMLEGDSAAAARRASGVFAGADAEQMYDAGRRTGGAYARGPFRGNWNQADAALPPDHWLRAMRTKPEAEEPEWDLYMMYPPGVRWEGETPPRPAHFIRHLGRGGAEDRSIYFRDRFDAEPRTGDLYEAMAEMASDALGAATNSAHEVQANARHIELLGFEGCPLTPRLRENLRSATARLGVSFRDVDLTALPEDDSRRGYPAPTILVDGADLFGLPQPLRGNLGCRVYPDGLPRAQAIAEAIRGLSSSGN